MKEQIFAWIDQLAASPHPGWWLFLLAFAESSFFPVPPDVLLITLGVADPERAIWYGFVCSVGSVLGGGLGYAIGLFGGRPLLYRVLDRSGHGELLVLFGIVAALGGADLFELVDMKGDVGALIAGILLAGHPRAGEMAKSLLKAPLERLEEKVEEGKPLRARKLAPMIKEKFGKDVHPRSIERAVTRRKKKRK